MGWRHLSAGNRCLLKFISSISPLFAPIFIALFAATLTFFGWRLLDTHHSAFRRAINRSPFRNLRSIREILSMTIVFISTYLFTLVITTSIEISFSIAILGSTLPFLLTKRKIRILERLKERAWPEAIDNIVSALLAGNSISEAITSLAETAPAPLRSHFARVAEKVRSGTQLEKALSEESEFLNSSTADQTLISLQLAKEFGGRDVTNTLRLLANFLRDQDESIEEIETKFGWVRNSAILGALAPWLLLALLSTQRNTVEAYQTSGGKIVLSIGVIATAIAYLLMDRISAMPKPPRIKALNQISALGLK